MLFHIDIKGDRLPPGTVCLTYDDGPGPRTEDLAACLSCRGIAATFFVIGRHAEQRRNVLGRLRDWGHLIGNHTYSHPGLVRLAVGIEGIDDILADLELGFAAARAHAGSGDPHAVAAF